MKAGIRISGEGAPLPLKFGPDGLIPAIIQDARTGQILMLAYMNEESLARTLQTGHTWFYSRSRQELWEKGATSGHYQQVEEIRTDCDADALVILVQQVTAACHEQTYSCFTRRVEGSPVTDQPAAHWPETPGTEQPFDIGSLLVELTATLQDRLANPVEGSYTSKLFAHGPAAACKKIGEEAVEVVLAAMQRDKENLAFEVADLWFHSLVAMVEAGISPAEVAEQLAHRRGKRRPADYQKPY